MQRGKRRRDRVYIADVEKTKTEKRKGDYTKEGERGQVEDQQDQQEGSTEAKIENKKSAWQVKP